MGCAPGVLVEERHTIIDAVDLTGSVRARIGARQGGGHDLQRLRRPHRGLRAAVGADLARGRAEPVGPPVSPIAPERLQLATVPFLEPLEELAVGGGLEFRVGEFLGPGRGDPGRDQARTGVVGEQTLNAQVEQLERVRRARGGSVCRKPERLVRSEVRVSAERERREVLRQQIDCGRIRIGEPEEVPFQVRDAAWAVGVPDEHLLAPLRGPVERPRQRLAAGQVRRCARGPVVGDGEITDTGVGQHERQAGRRSGTSVCIAVTTSTPRRRRRSCAKLSCRVSSSIDSASTCIVNGKAHTSNRPLSRWPRNPRGPPLA